MQRLEELQQLVPHLKVKIDRNMPNKLSGLYYDGTILLNANNSYQKHIETIAEEIGHYETSYGDITNYNQITHAKQEVKARRYGHQLILNLDTLIEAFKAGVQSDYELADYFDVSTEYIHSAVNSMKIKYGISHYHDGHIIRFEPLQVYKYIEY